MLDFNISNLWIVCLSDFLNVLIVLLYIRTQFKKPRVKGFVFPLWLLAYYALVLLCHLTQQSPFWLLVVNVAFIFSSTLLYNSTWQRRLLSTLFTYIILMLCEGAGVALTGLMQQYLNPFQCQLFKLVFIKGLALLVLQIYSQQKHISNTSYNRVATSTGIKLFIVPLLSFAVVSIFAFSLGDQPVASLTVITVLIVINILVFSLYNELIGFYDQRIKMHAIAEQTKYYRQYLNEIIDHQKTILLYQHDIKHNFLTIKSYLDTGDTNAAQNLVNKLSSTHIIPMNYSEIGILEVDTIINIKFTHAALVGVKVKLFPPGDEISRLQIDPNDIATILGNMLDNALEAIATMPQDSARFIELALVYKPGSLAINMKNPFSVLEKNTEGKYTTTKPEALFHGHGLDSIENIARQYNGTLVCTDKDGIFSTQVLLFEDNSNPTQKTQ